MNIDIWHSIRSYMDASIELAVLRAGPSHSAGPDYPVPKRIRELEGIIRDEEAKVRCRIASFQRFLIENGLSQPLERCPFRSAGGDRCTLTENHGGMHEL